MDTIANEPAPVGFDRVREAFRTSLELPAWRPGTIRIGVTRGDGHLVATAVLHDLRQARLFSIQMDGLGYSESTGDAARTAGCDVVFIPRTWTFRAAGAGDALGAA